MSSKPIPDADYETEVSGIDCGVVIDYYKPFEAGRYDGPPENCYPDDPAEISWHLIDRHGYPAEWLEKKMTKQEASYIEAELIKMKEDEVADYHDY